MQRQRIMQRSEQQGSSSLVRLTAPRRQWPLPAVLVLLVTIVYWPIVNNGFVSDGHYLKDNPALTSTLGLANTGFRLGASEPYYPLMHGMVWVESHLWGLDPHGYHVISLLLHAIAAVLVWRLLVRLELPGAWLAAATFALHPVEAESVACAGEQNNLLSCVLALGSILAYLRWSPPERLESGPRIQETAGRSEAKALPSVGAWRHYALALVLYVAALLSKTVAFSVPAVLLIIYWWKRGRVTRHDVGPLSPFFAIGLMLFVVTAWMAKTYGGSEGESWDSSIVEQLLISGHALWLYPGKLLWPHPWVFCYSRWEIDVQVWWQYLFPAAALAMLVGLWSARSRIGRGPLAAMLVFVGVLVPALAFLNGFSLVVAFVTDRYQYQASIALVALVAAGALVVDRLANRARVLAPLAGAALLLPLALMTWRQTHVYKDDIALAENIVEWNPESYDAHCNLARSLQERDKYHLAISHWSKAIEIREGQIRNDPSMAGHQEDLARSYVHLGETQRKAARPVAAEDSHRKAVEIREKLVRDNPTITKYRDDLATSYVEIGVLERDRGRGAEAESSWRKAIGIREKLVRDKPAEAQYQVNLAVIYESLGRWQQAQGWLTQAQASYARAIEIRKRLVGDHPTARDYQDDLGQCYVNLAFVLQKAGRPADAMASHGKALEIRQNLSRNNSTINKYSNGVAATYVDLALLDFELGRAAEAESSFHKAIAIRETLVRDDPASAEYQDGLAWCYVDLALLRQNTGRSNDAAAFHRQALEIREKLARNNPTVAQYSNQVAATCVDLGILERDLGRLAEAGVLCQKAVDIRERLVRDQPSVTDYRVGLGTSCANLAVTQLVSGCPAAAVIWCQKAVEIREKLVRDYPALIDYRANLGWSYANLGVAHSASGRPAEAEAFHRKAVNIRAMLVHEKPWVDDYRHELALSCRDLGDAQRATGRMIEAVASYRTAIAIREKRAADHPTVATTHSNLATDLALCGDALALSGHWSESGDLYDRAVAAGHFSWQIMGRSALVQLAAGNETGYRATCAQLASRYGDSPAPDTLLAIALALVAGENALSDMNRVLAIAERAAGADPRNPLGAVLFGAAQHRSGRGSEAIATLTKALAQLDREVSAAEMPDQVYVGRLLGEVLLVAAYHEQSNREAMQRHVEILCKVIEQPELHARPTKSGLPPWTGELAVEIADRELTKLGLSADENGQPRD